LLDKENNFVETLKIMSNAAKSFDSLATRAFYIIIYFDSSTNVSDLYSAKILDLSIKPFFH